MSEFPKPEFPVLYVSELKDGLDRLRRLVEERRDFDGAIPDLGVLLNDAYATGDPALKQAVRAIRDERSFRRVVEREVERYGRKITQRDTALPASLTADEVNKVIAAVDGAYSEVENLDVNGNDIIEAFEAEDLVGLIGLAGEFARVMLEIGGKLRKFRAEREAWNKSVADAIVTLEKRERSLEFIDSLADFHAATPEGANAIRMTIRAEMTRNGGEIDYWEIRRRLEDAETSFGSSAPRWLLNAFSFIGANRANATKKGHLSDVEVRKMLKTKDLAAYAAEQESIAISNVKRFPGVESWSDYVAGKDIPNLQQRYDPDFRPPER